MSLLNKMVDGDVKNFHDVVTFVFLILELFVNMV